MDILSFFLRNHKLTNRIEINLLHGIFPNLVFFFINITAFKPSALRRRNGGVHWLGAMLRDVTPTWPRLISVHASSAKLAVIRSTAPFTVRCCLSGLLASLWLVRPRFLRIFFVILSSALLALWTFKLNRVRSQSFVIHVSSKGHFALLSFLFSFVFHRSLLAGINNLRRSGFVSYVLKMF